MRYGSPFTDIGIGEIESRVAAARREEERALFCKSSACARPSPLCFSLTSVASHFPFGTPRGFCLYLLYVAPLQPWPPRMVAIGINFEIAPSSSWWRLRD